MKKSEEEEETGCEACAELFWVVLGY